MLIQLFMTFKVCACACAVAGRSHPERWWRRVYVEEFYPTVHLGDPYLEAMLLQHGLKVHTHPIDDVKLKFI